MDRHPEHDAVRETVRGWYRAATPEIGITAIETDYGFLLRSDRTALRRLILTVDSPALVQSAIADATERFASAEFEVWVDKRERARLVTPAIGVCGLEASQDTVILALVSSVRAAAGPGDLRVDDVVDEPGLRTWVTVKLQGFADSDDLPPPAAVEDEMATRKAEWPVCHYGLAYLDGHAVACLGHYTGRDQMVFMLATRVPYRRRGIAQNMLARWAEQAAPQQPRSLLINCDDGGRPSVLYRRIGFTDEVYWHRRYRRRDVRALAAQ